jgi:hypothetical protein
MQRALGVSAGASLSMHHAVPVWPPVATSEIAIDSFAIVVDSDHHHHNMLQDTTKSTACRLVLRGHKLSMSAVWTHDVLPSTYFNEWHLLSHACMCIGVLLQGMACLRCLVYVSTMYLT